MQGTAAYPYINTRDKQRQDLSKKWPQTFHGKATLSQGIENGKFCITRPAGKQHIVRDDEQTDHKSLRCLRDKRSALSNNCCCLTSLFSVIHCRLSSGQIVGKRRGTLFPSALGGEMLLGPLAYTTAVGGPTTQATDKTCVKCMI